MKSMYQSVADLNVAYGNSKGDPNNPDWERLSSQAKNILDEYNELKDNGLLERNMTELRDAICDIMVFTLGLAHLAGVPVESDMEAVLVSNLSKFCKDEQSVIDTVYKYSLLGVETYIVRDNGFPFVCVKSLSQQTGLDGKLYQKDKMLKSVSFVEPVFVSTEVIPF